MTVDFLQRAHELNLDFSPRDGISLLRYAIKRMAQDSTHPLSKDAAWRESVKACLGVEALDLEALGEKRRRTLGGNVMPTGLGDFFFHVEDPLRPEDGLEDEEFDVDDLD